jgi:hypothetical protein
VSERTCSVLGCAGTIKARGLCNKHYMHWRRDHPGEVVQRINDGPCSVEGCSKPARTRGKCSPHYNQALAAGSTCSVDGCGKRVQARGWCSAHYMRWRRTGTPHRPTTEQRFFDSIEEAADGCWTWTGTRDSKGYGNFYVGDRTFKAHRWSYEFFVFTIPEDLEIDHVCLNKPCVNPWHCETVPRIENQRRRRGVFRSDLRKCIRGHQMTLENIYVNPSGVQCCRICMKESLRRSRQRREVNPRKE